MDRKTKMVFVMGLLVLLLALTPLLFTGCKKEESIREETTETVTTDETDTDTDISTEEAVNYVCPMHPDEKSTDPDAECSECGMNLVPEDEVESGETETCEKSTDM